MNSFYFDYQLITRDNPFLLFPTQFFRKNRIKWAILKIREIMDIKIRSQHTQKNFQKEYGQNPNARF